MTQSSLLNTSSNLQQLFQRSPLLNSDSMLHGLLCALLSHPLEIENDHWYGHVQSLIERPSQKEKSALYEYAENIKQSLQSNDYTLQLPNECAYLSEKNDNHDGYTQTATHIANWIDGYIFAYAVSPFIQNAKKNEQVNEWITTLQESQRLLHQYLNSAKKPAKNSSQEVENMEQDLMEITEFIRISVYLARDNWHQDHLEDNKQSIH